MSSRINVYLHVANELADDCRAMTMRSSRVEVTSREEDCDALITDCPETAIAHLAKAQRVLFLRPFSVPEPMRTELSGFEHCMPGHLARFHAASLKAHEAVTAGRLGEPGLLRIHRWTSTGALSPELVIPEIDLSAWMFAKPADVVYGVRRQGFVQVHLGFDGGMALIDVDTNIPAGNEYYSLSIIGSTGAAHADDHHNMQLLLADGGTAAFGNRSSNLSLARMIDSFATSACDGRPFVVNWKDTFVAMNLADQVHQAMAEQQTVNSGDYRD